MSTAPPRVPKYRHYKPKDLAVVRIDGKDHYLGRYGSPTSRERYQRLVAEWLLGRKPAHAAETADGPGTKLSVSELVLAYWRHAEQHYRTPDGRPGQELENVRVALRPVRRLYGATPAADFGPLALRSVRDEMVRSGLARTTVNARINRVRRMFRWAVGHELVPPATAQALQAVEGLQPGRGNAREAAPVTAVPLAVVEATLPHLPAPVAAMVRLQLLTGMRAGEVTAMRGRDVERVGDAWTYRPGDHKNRWRGQARVIPLGPRARSVLEGFLEGDPDACVFSPRDAVRALHAGRSATRKTGRTPSEEARRSPDAGSRHRDRYDRRAYRQAIVRACERAGVPAWSPLQLRHTAATAIRARYGLEAAQVVLGHARADVTQVYAARDEGRARAIMDAIG
jgi:integrase